MVTARCPTCLSSGRRLRPLGNSTHRYNAMFSGLECRTNVQLRRLDAAEEVCWECRSLMHKILVFQIQVERARAELHSAAPNATYSHLNGTMKIGFDYEIQHDADNNNLKSEVPANNIERVSIKCEFTDNYRMKDELFYDGMIQDTQAVIGEFPAEIGESLVEVGGLVVEIGESEGENDNILLSETSLKQPKFQDKERKDKELAGVATLYKAQYTRRKMTEQEMWDCRAIMAKQEPYVSAQYKCETCIKNFSRQYILDKHNDDFHSADLGKHKCKICNVMFETENAMLRHCVNHYGLYACKLCNFQCVVLHIMKSHVALNHNDGQKYTCKRCRETFNCTIKLKYHQKTHYTRKLCTCDYCGKHMQKFYLVKHIRIHTGQPTFSCEVCGRVCRGEYTLRYHMRTRHGAGPKRRSREDVYCVECDLHFKTPAILQAHLQTTKRHAEHNLKFGCQFCQQKFLTAASVSYHVKRNHVETKCDVCGIMLRSVYGYRRHVRQQHGDGQPVTCPVCNKNIKHKRRMQEHMRTHTGERPLVCSLCGDTFRQRAALYTHKKLKHRDRNK